MIFNGIDGKGEKGNMNGLDTFMNGEEPSRQSAALAAILAAPQFPESDLATLRRMDPDIPSDLVFLRLMSTNGLLRNWSPAASASWESRWGLILHGLAVMTRERRAAHDPDLPFGAALMRAGYDENRLNRLLRARGVTLRTLLMQSWQFMARKGISFDWSTVTTLILAEDHNPERLERARQEIARDYYRADHQAGLSGSLPAMDNGNRG